MGMDQASLFHKWKDADKISELVSLVVFDRIGYQTNSNLKKYNFNKLKTLVKRNLLKLKRIKTLQIKK